MNRRILAFLVCGLVFGLCTTAVAVEPPKIDYEGLASELMAQGIPIPQTMDEAINDMSFTYLPEYEMTFDEKNNQYVVRTSVPFSDIDMMDNMFTIWTDFTETDDPHVFVVTPEADISKYTRIRMISRHENDPNVWPIYCEFDLKTGKCNAYRTAHFATDQFVIEYSISNFGSKMYTAEREPGYYYVDDFTYRVRDVDYSRSIWLYYDALTSELVSVECYDEEAEVTFFRKELYKLRFGEYLFEDGLWTKDGQLCEAPFQLTPDTYPYPSFLQ